MSFRLNALLPEASDELVGVMRMRYPLAHVSRNGTLVVTLPTNYEVSHATYPTEWSDAGADKPTLFRYRPDFTGGTVHEVHDFPEELVGTPYRLVLESPETGIAHSYCLITTGYSGERLRPYRRESDRNLGGEYTHPTSSVFSAPQMGEVRLDIRMLQKGGKRAPGGRLTVRRAKVEILDGLVVITQDQLFNAASPSLALSTSGESLTSDTAAWEPALLALYERMGCRARVCDGHYHLGD